MAGDKLAIKLLGNQYSLLSPFTEVIVVKVVLMARSTMSERRLNPVNMPVGLGKSVRFKQKTQGNSGRWPMRWDASRTFISELQLPLQRADIAV